MILILFVQSLKAHTFLSGTHRANFVLCTCSSSCV